MSIRRGLRNWLLETDSDPSVRFRVLRELLDRPADDPVVVRAQKAIGRKGWAAQLLRGQHPEGQWVTPGSSAYELYRPKYVATNWRLLVLADLGLTRKTPRVAKAVGLFLRRFSGPSGDLGGRGGEVCFTGNALRMLARFGYRKDPRTGAAIDWLVRHQKHDGGVDCLLPAHRAADRSGDLTRVCPVPPRATDPPGLRAIQRGAEFYLPRPLFP